MIIVRCLNMNYLENYISSILNEVNYIFSKEDKYYNFDNWKRRLYIVGLSGSGKTTLGKQLSEKYNVPYIELDNFFQKIFINKYGKDKYAELQYLDNNDPKVLSKEKELLDYVNNAFNIMESKILKIVKKCVIEGVDVHNLNTEKCFTKDDSVIVKETSWIHSFQREQKRVNYYWQGFDVYHIRIKNGLVSRKKINEFENKIKEIYRD